MSRKDNGFVLSDAKAAIVFVRSAVRSADETSRNEPRPATALGNMRRDAAVDKHDAAVDEQTRAGIALALHLAAACSRAGLGQHRKKLA